MQFLHRNKKKNNVPQLNNLAMELRKCCNHPFLLKGVEDEVEMSTDENEIDSLINSSGKLIFLDKLLPKLRENGHRILIFSQFKIMLDILEDFLNMRDFPWERIDGSITGMKRQAAIDRYQSNGNAFIMLLSTRAGGVGINLTAADTVVIFDSDWNPQNDLQAQARCHRIGQTKHVKVYRLLCRKTYELQMFHMASLKMGLDQAVLQGIENDSTISKEEVEKLLRHGAYDIFNEEKEGISEIESNQFIEQDIDTILQRRTKTIVHESNAGSTFSKASFKGAQVEETVDVDDPEFWNKVVGDIKEPEPSNLPLKRNRKSFQQPEQQTPSDKVPQQDLPAHEKIERFKWGGSTPTEWLKSDIEKILTYLQTFGYGRLKNKVEVRDVYSVEEVQRMGWSIVLACLLELAQHEVRESTRAKERAIEKSKESLENEPNDKIEFPVDNVDLMTFEQKVEVAFEKLWKLHQCWAVKAVTDANQYTMNNSPREKGHIEFLRDKKWQNALYQKFEENVLPALKSRGWNVEQINGREDELPYMKYTYDNRTWTNVALRCVLNESKSLHPELSNVIDKLLDSCSQQKEETISLTLDAETLTVEKLQEFLWKFAPLQLQFDGCKPKRRVASLNKRLLLNSCYNMHRAVKLVSRVSSTCDDKLSREINITNKAPHPYWKPIHDATLIRGIMKHGWLERSHDDIVNDESLNWDSLLEEDSDSCSISIPQEETMSRRDKAKMLRRVADRTVRFFDKNDEFILTIKGFDREKTLLNYGIVTKYSKFGKKAFYSLDTTMLVDTEEEEKIEPCLDFPSKEKLVKRAKSILSPNPKKKQAPVAEVKTNDHGYPIMDESDRCYMLLSELLKGLVKLPFNKPHEIQSWFKTLKLAREEASNFTKLSEEMKQLHDHLLSMEGVGTNISITPLKNVIRAILGMKVAQQKNTESLFFVKKNPSTGEAALNSCLKAVSNENCLKLNYVEYFMLKVFTSFGIPYSEHL